MVILVEQIAAGIYGRASLFDARSSLPMTDPGPITVIFDDVDPSLIAPAFSVPINHSDTGYPCKYNNTLTVLDLGPGDSVGFYTFDGSTVQLYGVAPPSQSSQTFFVNTPDHSQEYSYHAPGYGGLQYTSTPNASLSMVLTQAVLFGLDYAVVTVHPTTDLIGKTILVDDSSSSLIWRGSWTEENNFTLPVFCPLPFSPNSTDFFFICNMAPHANTTHASQTTGDEFEFWFTGTSIFVYGVTPSEPNSASSWLLRMSFTLDAAEPVMVNFTLQDFQYEQPHVVYFNASNIPAGNHTLVGRVVDIAGSTLTRARIDYITYKPSFVSEVEMPVLPPFAPTTTATSSTTMATSSTTIATSSISPTSSSEAASGRAKVKIIRTAVGGAVGAIVLCAVAVALVVYMRRRQRRNRSRYQVDEAFSGSSASTSYIIPVGEKRGTMRLGNDTATQELRTVAQEPVYAGPAAEANFSQPLVDTPAVHGDDLEQLPPAAPRGNTEMDSRFLELQTRMEQLTQEVREQVLPPPYGGDA
ncbi:hypothetical protein C8F01DRAFT_338259 [Mycena amicta]|nr:hypothetical protein C8F01DRAFT_338259 [Mycena amicta]